MTRKTSKWNLCLKDFCKITLGILILGISLDAQALEPSSTVKVTPLLKTTESWNHKSIAYPVGKAEITSMLIEIAPGAETGWHLHPVPSFGYLLEGTLEIRLKDGQIKKLQSGEALVEVVNTLHNGRNVGTVPVKILVFYAGAEGQTLTVKESDVKN